MSKHNADVAPNLKKTTISMELPAGVPRTLLAKGPKGPRGPRGNDVVNHPSHYAPNGVDSFMHMKDQMGKVAFDGFLQGNAIKYIQRYQFKGKPVEDLTKAAFYLFHLAFEAADTEQRPDLLAHLEDTLAHAAEHFGEKTEVK